MKSSLATLTTLLLILIAVVLAACSQAASAQQGATLNPIQSQGRSLFKSTCATCHATSGDTVIVGPSLAGIATRAAGRVPGMDARDYIQQSILDPRAYTVEGFPEEMMPTGFSKQFSQEQIESIIAYLLTLEN